MTARQPTVLFVAVPAALGGSNQALLTLLRSLRGSAVRVLAAPSRGAMATTAEEENAFEEFVGLPSRRRPGRVVRVLHALRLVAWVWPRRHTLTAIHANATTGFYLALPAALIGRIPLVVWVHDSVSTPWGRRLGRITRLLPMAVEWAAVSPTARDVIVANEMAAVTDVEIVPNPISKLAVTAIQELATHDHLRVGFLGAATAAKGFDLLPGIMRETADLPITWKLYVNRKESEFEQPVWEEIDALNLDVETMGRMQDVRDAYAQCDLVLNPTRHESFSRVTAEALINGIPVVGSDIPAIRDLIRNSGAGVLFPSADASAAAAAVRAVVADPEELDRLRVAARSSRQDFDPSVVADRMLTIYQRHSKTSADD